LGKYSDKALAWLLNLNLCPLPNVRVTSRSRVSSIFVFSPLHNPPICSYQIFQSSGLAQSSFAPPPHATTTRAWCPLTRTSSLTPINKDNQPLFGILILPATTDTPEVFGQKRVPEELSPAWIPRCFCSGVRLVIVVISLLYCCRFPSPFFEHRIAPSSNNSNNQTASNHTHNKGMDEENPFLDRYEERSCHTASSSSVVRGIFYACVESYDSSSTKPDD